MRQSARMLAKMNDLKGARYELSWMPPKFHLRTYRSPPRHSQPLGYGALMLDNEASLTICDNRFVDNFIRLSMSVPNSLFHSLVNTNLGHLRLGLEMV